MLSSAMKAFPYRERLSYAVTVVCIVGLTCYHTVHITTALDRSVALLATVAFVCTCFCGYRSRPFWFFWGIINGALLVAILTQHDLVLRLHIP